MAVDVVAYRDEWPQQFAAVAEVLTRALAGVASAEVEHVGSTAVPGLAAKPVIDVDVVVEPGDVPAAIAALASIGYVHRGDLGVVGREAFTAPDDEPRRHVYVCEAGTPSVRNHLAVRDVLRERPDLRDEYAAVKASLATDPSMTIDRYLAGKSEVLQKVLAASSLLTAEERRAIDRLNRGLDPTSGPVADASAGPS
ncbi:GrpB family protein [Nocardioides deserti]|uniref:GrpB family protein n=1 Tax=Nocardioides deserti TaxID=1588644 RepID=A0ABR6U3N7_9ACTN|nr:GrpB family protein [Nocardioides deserti]MBC2959014.1 GrpB family protein [Nocardioides deserti]GGO68975.1 hypothetical protein GCM10012276_04060 [Nocardioides deserti]